MTNIDFGQTNRFDQSQLVLIVHPTGQWEASVWSLSTFTCFLLSCVRRVIVKTRSRFDFINLKLNEVFHCFQWKLLFLHLIANVKFSWLCIDFVYGDVYAMFMRFFIACAHFITGWLFVVLIIINSNLSLKGGIWPVCHS